MGKEVQHPGGEDRYILVDLDHTLAYYSEYEEMKDAIGKPVPAMVERVQRWLHTGMDVRIFTARASRNAPAEMERIRDWCKKHIGRELKVQNWKDFGCVGIWDNLAVTVEPNTGWRMTITTTDGLDPLSKNEEKALFNYAYKKEELATK